MRLEYIVICYIRNLNTSGKNIPKDMTINILGYISMERWTDVSSNYYRPRDIYGDIEFDCKRIVREHFPANQSRVRENDWDSIGVAECCINTNIDSTTVWALKITCRHGMSTNFAVGIIKNELNMTVDLNKPNKRKVKKFHIRGVATKMDQIKSKYYSLTNNESNYSVRSHDRKWEKHYFQSLKDCTPHIADYSQNRNLLLVILDVTNETLRFARATDFTKSTCIDWISPTYGNIECGNGICYRLFVSSPNLSETLATHGHVGFEIVDFKQNFDI